jgi:hypothetical protein
MLWLSVVSSWTNIGNLLGPIKCRGRRGHDLLCDLTLCICVILLCVFVWSYFVYLCGLTLCICVILLCVFVWSYFVYLCDLTLCICVILLCVFVWSYFVYLCGLTLCIWPSWSWSNGSWIYNLCNQCLSPLTLWVRITLRRDELDKTLCNKVCQWLVAGRWFSPGTPVPSTNKTVRHDLAEILLKVVFNTITL